MPADVLRKVGHTVRRIIGKGKPNLMAQLIRSDVRSTTFFEAIEFVNYERVAGDIVECGVFGGLSLAMLAKGASFDPKGMARRVVGIDSFEGLPDSADAHARWQEGDCAVMRAPHPVLAPGERVTPEATREVFRRCGLEPPVLHAGRFDVVLKNVVPAVHPAIALLHVDCDLYESTREVLDGVASAFQDGTMLLFDDWFHYRGSPRRGEARAFGEFLDAHPEWEAVHWRSYGPFANAFILSRR